MSDAFLAAKNELAAATVLKHPYPTAAVSLAIDASVSHIGGILEKWNEGMSSWASLSYWSKKLSSANAIILSLTESY